MQFANASMQASAWSWGRPAEIPKPRGRWPQLECAGQERVPARPQWSQAAAPPKAQRSEEHTSELQSPCNLVCRLLLEKKKKKQNKQHVDCISHVTDVDIAHCYIEIVRRHV